VACETGGRLFRSRGGFNRCEAAATGGAAGIRRGVWRLRRRVLERRRRVEKGPVIRVATDSKKPQDSNSTADAMREMNTLGSVGFAFVLSIVIGCGAGLLVDRLIGRGHWGFFIGFFLGLAAGVVSVIRASQSIK
jgi:F0F1-type ATP synthase assembly protein I